MVSFGRKLRGVLTLLLAGLAGVMAAPSSAEETPGSDALANGKLIFKSRCQQCHTIEIGTGNSTGPNLNGVVGRGQGLVEGFSYSEAFSKRRGEPWNADRLAQFLASPRKAVPGTLMVFSGLSQERERYEVIQFLLHPE